MKSFGVPVVLDLITGHSIKAVDFFLPLTEQKRDEIHAQRRALAKAKNAGEKLWVCDLCHEPIRIVGGRQGGKRDPHFKHFSSDKPCLYKTEKSLPLDLLRSIKYNGAKESELHKKLKETVADILRIDRDACDIDVEKTHFHQDGGRERRRPDVSCSRKGIAQVFEIQISSDFIDVIVGREEFYRSQGTYILWLFNQFRPDFFTTKDIYVGNQKNAYVFNERTESLSRVQQKLILECHFKQPFIEDGIIKEHWQSRDISLDDLTYDNEQMQAHLFHYDAELKKLQIEKLRNDFEHYWCEVRGSLNNGQKDYQDQIFEKKLSDLLKEPVKPLSSAAEKIIDLFYSLKTGKSLRTKQNLFGVVDVAQNCRKQFSQMILWGVGAFGYKNDFLVREAFKKKLSAFRKGLKSDPKYQRDTSYDALFLFLFPEIEARIESLPSKSKRTN